MIGHLIIILVVGIIHIGEDGIDYMPIILIIDPIMINLEYIIMIDELETCLTVLHQEVLILELINQGEQ